MSVPLCRHCGRDYAVHSQHLGSLLAPQCPPRSTYWEEGEPVNERNIALEEAAVMCETNSGEVGMFVEAKGRIGDFFAMLIRKMRDR